MKRKTELSDLAACVVPFHLMALLLWALVGRERGASYITTLGFAALIASATIVLLYLLKCGSDKVGGSDDDENGDDAEDEDEFNVSFNIKVGTRDKDENDQ